MAINIDALLAELENETQVVVQPFSGFPFPYGNIGPWHKADLYVVSGYNILNALVMAGLKPDDATSIDKGDDGSFERAYYVQSRRVDADAAQKLVTELNNQTRVELGKEPLRVFGANLVVQYSVPTGDVLPSPANFEMKWDVDKRGWGTRNSEAYQLVTLTSSVWALAKLLGFTVPDISFSEIANPKEIDIAEADIPQLWDQYTMQRKALWEALGEPRVEVYMAKGMVDAKGKVVNGKYVTQSDTLSKILKLATNSWSGKLYYSMGQCGHPSGRGRIPVVMRAWHNKQDAEIYLAEREARRLEGGENYEEAVTVNEWADYYVMDGLSPEIFADALSKDILPLVAGFENATGAAKLIAGKTLQAKIAEYGMTQEQWQKWLTKLTK